LKLFHDQSRKIRVGCYGVHGDIYGRGLSFAGLHRGDTFRDSDRRYRSNEAAFEWALYRHFVTIPATDPATAATATATTGSAT
jgi:hypothetical protein